MRNFKRIMAILLSASMIFGSNTVMAAELPTNGTIGKEDSELEGYVNKNVFKYQVPTASSDALKMILDPQKLIKDTQAAAYTGAGYSASDFEDATVLFHRSNPEGGAKTFASTSDSLSVCNLGTVSMNVSFTTDVTGTTGITFASSNEAYTAATTPAVFLTMNVTANPAGETILTNGTKKAVSTNGEKTMETMTVSSGVVDGVKTKYKASYNGMVDGKKKYTYEIPSANAAAALSAAIGDKFAFQYEAKANDVEGWANVTSNPRLSLTYKFERVVAGGVNVTTVYDSTDRMYKTTLPAALTGLSDVTSFTVNGANVSSSNYTLNSGKTILRTTKDGLKAALGVTSLPENFTFTIVANGTTYVSQVSRD